ncbi:MAG TPA: hypothetical protein VIM81_19770 [Gammaproteobacteria bacterium]
MELLEALTNNALSIWLRESTSIFAYPTLIAIHTIGMAFLVGTSCGVALRMIGFAPDLPLSSLAGFFRLMWLGLVINAISGALLVMQDATTFLTMPTFYLKLLAIAAAMTLVRLLQRSVRAATDASAGVTPGARAAAFALFGAWLIAVTAGRVTAYASWVGIETAVAVVTVTAVLLVAGFVVVRVWLGAHRPPVRRADARARAATLAKH